MKKCMVLFVFVFLLSKSFPAASSETLLTIATLDWKPYVGENLPDKGYLAEISTEVLRRAGYKVEYKFHPWKRALILGESGEVDGVLGAFYSDSRAEYLEYPQPIAKIYINFFHRTDQEISFNTLNDLKSYSIGVLLGSTLETDLQQAHLKTESITHHKQNLRKLLMGRIDLTIAATEWTLYMLKNEFSQAERDQISILNPPYQVNNVYLTFSKRVSHYRQLTEEFNKALELMHEDGTYYNILKKHGIPE